MNLITLLTTLESKDTLERMVQSSNSKYGDVVTYVTLPGNTLNCTINSSTTYSNVATFCLLVKDDTTYLYLKSKNQRYHNKVSISTITSISITAAT